MIRSAQMNTDANFLRHCDWQLQITKMETVLRTATLRLERAKIRHEECVSLYEKAEEVYLVKEDAIRNRLNANMTSSPGFRVTFASSMVASYQARLQNHKDKLQAAQTALTASQQQLQEAQQLLGFATTTLTHQFAEKNANVPHIVEYTTFALAQSVATQYSQLHLKEEYAYESLKLVQDHEKLVDFYTEDLMRAVEIQKQLTELKLLRQRDEAHHENAVLASRQALNSAQIKVNEIQESIKALQLQRLRFE